MNSEFCISDYSISFLFDAQEKAAFIFCVEDRALFCQDCDEPIHSAGSLSANHQRYLATGIRVAVGSSCSKDTKKSCLEPPNQSAQQTSVKLPVQQPSSFNSSWAVDDLMQFSDFESSTDKVMKLNMDSMPLLIIIDIEKVISWSFSFVKNVYCLVPVNCRQFRLLCNTQ